MAAARQGPTLHLGPHPYQACSRDAFLLVRRSRPAQRSDGSDRGCPLGTGIDPSMWHANGTTGGDDAACGDGQHVGRRRGRLVNERRLVDNDHAARTSTIRQMYRWVECHPGCGQLSADSHLQELTTCSTHSPDHPVELAYGVRTPTEVKHSQGGLPTMQPSLVDCLRSRYIGSTKASGLFI
jgi:hypothetical protein